MDWFQKLKDKGINIAEYGIANDKDEAVKLADKIGYPVVIKVESNNISHKTDFGGVKINNHNNQDVIKACDEIAKETEQHGKSLDGYLVQKQTQGIELIIGGKKDPQFGQLIVFGLGGIFVEIFKDVSIRVCPITEKDANEMIKEIKAYPILNGARGHKPVNKHKLKELLVKMSELLLEINAKELDLNPVMVNENGYTVVDVRVIE